MQGKENADNTVTRENVNLKRTFEKEDSKLVLMLTSSKEEKYIYIIAYITSRVCENKINLLPFLILLSCIFALVIW